MKIPKHILPVIVIAQFCCTSLWFAGNGIMDDLIISYNLDNSALGHLTSAVQFGFISGTLFFAIFTLVDRYSPSLVFFTSAVLAAASNVGLIWDGNTIVTLFGLRFLTGFFLAGIYPVGMKIAADYYSKGLGKSLGFLVGALVLGTAFPHLLSGLSIDFPWKQILLFISGLSFLGGLVLYLLVPNGPNRKKSQNLNFSAFNQIFKHRAFRQAAFGYFGHMWELYAFWAFVPIILQFYIKSQNHSGINISLLSFIIIAIGGVSCAIAGIVSIKLGTRKTASIALALSGLCCLLSPLMFQSSSWLGFLFYLLIWGIFVIADSPLFSALVAQNAIPELKGTALTMVNGIGFAITIISIQLLTLAMEYSSPQWIFLLLGLGPAFGLKALLRNDVTTQQTS